MFNRLAVIGFDAQFDRLENVDRVAAAFYKGDLYSGSAQLATTYSDAQLYQHIAERALQVNKLMKQQVAVIIICEQQPELLQEDQYKRCARVASFGEALTLSSEIIHDLDIAVLIIAAHLPIKPIEQSQATFAYDQTFTGYGESGGIAGVLLSSESFAVTANRYIYSYVNACAATDNLQKIEQTIAQSFTQAQVSAQDISSLEVSAPAAQSLLSLEENGLLNAYKTGLTLQTSLSCIKSVMGENGALSQLCGFLNCVFALQQRYRPSVQGWMTPQKKQLASWLTSPFYLLNNCAPAFPDKNAKARLMAYSCLSTDNYAHLILQENSDNRLRENGFNAHSDLSLFIINGNSQGELLAQLTELESRVGNAVFKNLARHYYQQSLRNNEAKYCLVLLADSPEQLNKEIALALTGLASAFANNSDWKTPQGSYFCINRHSAPKISFLYPGIGATYLGLGRDLLHLFPAIFPSIEKLISESAGDLKVELLTPRSVVRLGFAELKKHDLALRSSLADIAECGVAYACIFTRVFTDLLEINADFAAGYSMGEVSMFAALNCWQNPGQMSGRLANSQTFTRQLSGELTTLRSLWQLPAIADGGEKLLWESYNIKGSKEQVANAIAENERVYITLINTADSLVIAGYPADCLRVAQRLGVRAIALNVHNAIHSEPAYQQYQQMVELYSMDLAPRIETKLFSSSCYLPIPFNKKAISISLAKCLCEPVDFPRLINTLVAQGSSLFIEMGAGRSLCSWTDKILAGSHTNTNAMTVAVNAKGSDQQLMIMRAIAKLLSFGVTMNLKHFFYGSIVAHQQKE